RSWSRLLTSGPVSAESAATASSTCRILVCSASESSSCDTVSLSPCRRSDKNWAKATIAYTSSVGKSPRTSRSRCARFCSITLLSSPSRFPLSTTAEADIAMHTATNSDTTLTSGNSARPLSNGPGAGELCRIAGRVPQACQFSAKCLSEPLTFRFGQGVLRLCDRIEFLQHRIKFSPQRWFCRHLSSELPGGIRLILPALQTVRNEIATHPCEHAAEGYCGPHVPTMERRSDRP